MNKFKKFFRTFCLFFLCTMCALLCACSGGFDLDEIDEEDLDDYQMGVVMDNVKILRRSYGEGKASAVATTESYYDKYVKSLFTYFTNVYGIVNRETKGGKINIFNELSTEISLNTQGLFDDFDTEIIDIVSTLDTDLREPNPDDYFKYYYDAMRYQVVEETAYYVPKWKIDLGGGVFEYSNAATQPADSVANTQEFTTAPNGILPSDVTYYMVVADTTKGWNWGLNYELGASGEADAFLKAYPGSTVSGTRITTKVDAADYKYKSGTYNGFYGYYMADDYLTDYGIEFSESAYTNQIYNPLIATGFEQALTYVIYCIVNNQIPNNITVSKTASGNNFSVEGFSAAGGKTSLELALASAKQNYVDNASYVGLTKTDQESLVKYILDNVIGRDAVNYSKTIQATSRYDLHYEEMVSAIVAYCTALTPTGETKFTAEDEANGLGTEGATKNQTFIGGQYLSSDIVDYAYNTSFVNGDAIGFDEFAHLGQYEYQSMLFMPKEDSKIDEIWLDFGYFGNGGKGDTITIRTYIRNYKGNGNFDIYTKDIVVSEGIVDVGEDGTTLCFDFTDTDDGYLKCDAINFDDAINSAYYQARVKGIRPLAPYSKEIVIGNSTDARNYYSLIEGEYRDYGVFNHNILYGTEYYESSYVEIAFEVISATTNNYKFFCGCSIVNNYTEPDYSKFQ